MSSKRSAEAAGLDVTDIPRAANSWVVFLSSARYVHTGKPPQKKANQVGDTVAFLDEHPDIFAWLQEVQKDVPEDAEDHGVKGYVAWVSHNVWKHMSKEEKQPFVEEAKMRSLLQLELYPGYTYHPKPSKRRKASASRAAKPKRTPAIKNGKTTASASPQSTTSSPFASSSSSLSSPFSIPSLSPFTPGMLFTPGTAIQPFSGSPEMIPAANFDYAPTNPAFSKEYDGLALTGPYILPAAACAPESSLAQSTPCYGLFDFDQMNAPLQQSNQSMVGTLEAYYTQSLQPVDTTINMGYDAQYTTMFQPPPNVEENGSWAVLGGGPPTSPQGDYALLDYNQGSSTGMDLLNFNLDGSPVSLAPPLSEFDFMGTTLDSSLASPAGAPLDSAWQGGSPSSHVTPLFDPGF